MSRICKSQGADVKFALSPERNKYVVQHRGFGGTSYVYLNNVNDAKHIRKIILSLKGFDEVLDKIEACKRFHLMPARIRDLVVLGDINTVFGDLPSESEIMPDNYRSHGSRYEASVPIFI